VLVVRYCVGKDIFFGVAAGGKKSQSNSLFSLKLLAGAMGSTSPKGFAHGGRKVVMKSSSSSLSGNKPLSLGLELEECMTIRILIPIYTNINFINWLKNF
jgi:hypothetical protein